LNLEFNPTTALPEFSVSLGDDAAEVHLAQIFSALDNYVQKLAILLFNMIGEQDALAWLIEQ
jgi:hypothetical protein